MSRRALLIATGTYADRGIADLPAALRDAAELRTVLEDPTIGRYEVDVHTDLTADGMRSAIADFCGRCETGDLALIVVTGHGMQAEDDELVLVASDTTPASPGSGVRADFVDDQLDSCLADSRILMLDTCHAGAFTLGFRVQGSKSLDEREAGERRIAIQDRGVHVLASSDATERSFTRRGPAGSDALSVFIGAVVDVLREGAAGSSARDFVSVEDLFQAVTSRLTAIEPPQTPVRSALRSAGQVAIAFLPHGASGRAAARGAEAGVESNEDRPAEPEGVPAWPDVLRYFRSVSEAEDRMPLMDARRGDFAVLSGIEHPLSGRGDGRHSDPEQFGIPAAAADLVDRAEQNGGLWAGWPCVVVWDGRSPKVAPLLMREVEVCADGATLRPIGDAVLHPGLAANVLHENTGDVLADFHVHWRSGEARRMAEQAGNLLRRIYGVPLTHQLEPDNLATNLGLSTPGDGARNVSVLFTASNGAIMHTLRQDLDQLTKHPAPGSALDALRPDGPPDRGDDRPFRSVTPLATNPAQLRVLRSAMTRRLTVATGPPGTGKSQLVVNAVATAVAAHQNVLVASTNNPAVDEVHRRCMEIAPSLLTRTGNKKYQEKEKAQLQAIIGADDQPPPSLETREFELEAAEDDLAEIDGLLSRHGERERALLVAGRVRADLEQQLGCGAAELDQRLGRGWGVRSSRLAGARLFGGFRRRRWLTRAGSPADDHRQRCRELAELATATERWERLREVAAPTDEQLRTDSAGVRVAHQGRSLAYIRDVALDRQQKGRSVIEQLERGDGSWDLRAAALPYLGGWALTSLSARRFKTTRQFDLVIIDEAGQCGIGTILPLLHQAKRALVIGDGMQLPHICNLEARIDRQLRSKHDVGAHWLFQNKMSPRRHSAFDAAAHAAGETLLLDEHYRCAPPIAALSNRQFYGGALTILTDVRANGQAPTERPIRWHDVRGRPERGPRDRSWQNPDEVAVVVDIVRELRPSGSTDTSVGVVTPSRAQADAIRSALGDVAEPEPGPSDERLVRVGTAHAFQGGERDLMVFSLVAAHDGGGSEAVRLRRTATATVERGHHPRPIDTDRGR